MFTNFLSGHLNLLEGFQINIAAYAANITASDRQPFRAGVFLCPRRLKGSLLKLSGRFIEILLPEGCDLEISISIKISISELDQVERK